MLGLDSVWHWLIVLVIVMMIFGTKKLRNIGQDLGGAVKGFKEGMRDASADKPVERSDEQQAGAGHIIEGEIKEKVKS